MTVPMISGMTDVHARIATIRSRIASVSPPSAPGFPPATPASSATPTTGPVSSVSAMGAPAPVGRPVAPAVSAAEEGLPTSSAAWAERLPPDGRRISGMIERAAREAGVDPALLAALVKNESGFDPTARSHAGAIGLAQLMPGTAAELEVDPTDPLENLRGGARYLREQLDRFGTPELALAAYNAGPGRVSRAGGIPRITETQNYVERVMTSWRSLQ